MAQKESILTTIRSMKSTGNPWYCLITEPLWGIPYTLFVPFAAVYMQLLGLSPMQIGIVATVMSASQIVASFLAGSLTDKLGRRWCTFIFDTIAWSVPTLLWTFAQSFEWFVIGAVFNGMLSITTVSWNCLMVEDAPESKMVQLFSVMYIAGQIAVFFSPLATLLVNRFDTVTVVRGLYAFAFLGMTTKFIVLQIYSRETGLGKRRKQEVKDIPFLRLVTSSFSVLRDMLKRPAAVGTIVLLAISTTVVLINNNFWSLFVTNALGIDEGYLGIFVFVKSAVQLFCYLFIGPRISTYRFRNPLLIGWGILASAQAMLFFLPPQAVVMVGVYVVLEAVALSIILPIADSLIILNADPREKARNMGITHSLVQVLVLPFGSVGGMLSSFNRAAPFALNIALIALGAAMAFVIDRARRKEHLE